MSRLVSLCHPIGEKDADIADIGFRDDINIGDLDNYVDNNKHLDLRYIWGLISQADEAMFPSGKNGSGKWSRNLRVSKQAGESFKKELGLTWPVYCPVCDPCGDSDEMMILAGRSILGEVEVSKGLVIGRLTPKNNPSTTIAWMTYNLFYVCTDAKCGAIFPIFYRDPDDKEALKNTGYLKKSAKTEFVGRCAFCGFYGRLDQYPMTNVGNLIWVKKFISSMDLGDLPTDEMDIRYDWAVVCPKCRVMFPTARNENGKHDPKRYKKALVTKPMPRVYQNRYCPVCDSKRKRPPLKVGMRLDIGNITHKMTGEKLADLFLDSFYICDNKAGGCESIFTLYPLVILDYM